jgi:hypothetical protein
MPPEDIAQDSIHNVRRCYALIVPTRPAQRQLCGVLD